MVVGFSTGSLALGNFRLGLQMVRGQRTKAIELSALREEELQSLVDAIDSLPLDDFTYISFHAPSRLVRLTESELIEIMQPVIRRCWPIIVHPDVISDFEAWATLGSQLCVENMDKRKRVGRTALELQWYFDRLPESQLCFDIGHARQIDPTMLEAEKILRQFGERLKEVHLSLVTSSSSHERLKYECMVAFQRVAHLINPDAAIILETPVIESEMSDELEKAAAILNYGRGDSN